MILPQRLLDIATGKAGLPPDRVAKYRLQFAARGFEVPPWDGAPLPEPLTFTLKPVKPVPDSGIDGVGTRIKSMLSGWGIHEINCDCQTLAREMDAKGPAWVRENLDSLAERITNNAKNHKWMRYAPFKRLGAKLLILKAIEQMESDMAREELRRNVVWAVGMTTAPRQLPTIRESLASARFNDWEPTIFAEPESDLAGVDARVVQHSQRHGVFHNWLFLCRWLLENHPEATHILTMQDDAVIVPNSRLLIERWITDWPANAGLLSLYLPPNRERKGGKRREPGIFGGDGHVFHGNLAVVHRRDILVRILNHGNTQRWSQRMKIAAAVKDDDICIGNTLMHMRLKMYYTAPSCCQHIAHFSSRVGGSKQRAPWMANDALADCPLV